ncbi:MAG: hypothetical protein IKO07_09465 [Clostridia bacterium]|nr:hypothetical protein [Clostridia bacterium]
MIAQAQYTICDLNDASAEVIVGTQTAATNAWTGRASFSELKDGLTILYWLPYAGTSSAATLNLTLADGTTTGAKNVYINGTSRCTTHVAVGNVTQMTYRVNTPVNGSGSYTGWWITRNQDTTTNYYDRINYKASVTAAGAIVQLSLLIQTTLHFHISQGEHQRVNAGFYPAYSWIRWHSHFPRRPCRRSPLPLPRNIRPGRWNGLRCNGSTPACA